MILLAVDPSINCSGIAIFKKGELIWVSPVKHKGPSSIQVRAAKMAIEILNAAHPFRVTTLVTEWPQIYTHGDNDRNDLLGLAAVCGAVVLEALRVGVEALHYTPHEWTQNLKKSKSGDPKKSPRGLYIGRRLEGKELDIWKGVTSHDVVDAIGLGLHHLGRMERKRVFPGASK